VRHEVGIAEHDAHPIEGEAEQRGGKLPERRLVPLAVAVRADEQRRPAIGLEADRGSLLVE